MYPTHTAGKKRTFIFVSRVVRAPAVDAVRIVMLSQDFTRMVPSTSEPTTDT